MDPKTIVQQLVAGGMSQTKIAIACGCSQAAISDIASGKTEDPRSSIVDSLRLLHAAKAANPAPQES